ncbi:TraB/GumN family protein [Novosphingobium album (ex Hu et al. 2023)]|uniref:TraB/GumN family protein n=1 Tax=Novosphingobium album (ex Hu et al. 2023) TaxID=2930093 RepID=A0ABT0AX90_9SPHN|nr:TraB/GumN family protein [Novosphingobium album (ex Hu et al. 2023)]MCJ2177446.1 TraB/GumN family protein [Novosphingobium album (ex Hu et al. 2023)]
MRRWFLALSALALLGCAPTPQKADPALWHIESADGHEGWLFGTIHSAPGPLEWRTATVGDALDGAGTIMVEVANLADEAAVGAAFAALAKSEGQPPLSQRIAPAERPALAALLKRNGFHDGDFAAMDTWAAALTIVRQDKEGSDPRYGVDRAVIAQAGNRPVVELEGATRQLSIFDALPEKDQRDLLSVVVQEADKPDLDLPAAWREGDMTAIEQDTRTGLLADPELRAALFTGRNRQWAASIAQAVQANRKPFVAVGAAHMAGPDGLPAMLASQGFTVTRVE